MNKLKYIITSVLLIGTMASCDTLTGDPELRIPLDETLAVPGAFLRVVSVETAAFDVGDPANANYTFVGEVSDESNGALGESVTFYASYVDVDRQNIQDEIEIKTYQVSNFTINEESGLPRNTFSVSLNEILDGYGNDLNLADVSIGDRFDVRWELATTDGRTISSDDMSPATTGGFYASPFFARVNVVVSLAESAFVGSYNFNQQAASTDVAGAFGNGWIWEGAQSFDADLSVNPDNTLNGRTFTVTPLQEFGVAARTYSLDFGLFVTIATDVTTGLTCGGGIFYGPASDNRGSFDPQNDASFEMVVKENSLGDCGLSGEEIVFDVTKN